jgi:septum formation protein
VPLILASASPARRAVLQAAGIRPVVVVSEVDEDAIAATMAGEHPTDVVTALAAAKAADVAERVGATHPDAVVIGCDSMLLIDGGLVGKPGTVEVARKRWLQLAGGSGDLITGHAVVRLVGGRRAGSAEGVECTTIRFGTPTDVELDAYLATGEPLEVAGGFTLDGLGGWFVDCVDGDPSSVIGISLPLTRRLLAKVGITVTDLWTAVDQPST